MGSKRNTTGIHLNVLIYNFCLFLCISLFFYNFLSDFIYLCLLYCQRIDLYSLFLSKIKIIIDFNFIASLSNLFNLLNFLLYPSKHFVSFYISLHKIFPSLWLVKFIMFIILDNKIYIFTKFKFPIIKFPYDGII